ncbi:DedA family protein [Halanaeroarchaeum sulfurireducens]|uniref:Putative membrane-associated protein n=1 Tax=Halanaeroarchaeum sulfurireducens TaxID=1604004 RepID=A0A0F7P8L1_9EURY|nr:VTT domain-containing protein [Halanaeroarchaeum sulfurireducens]AKH97501.1 putative membrane-associated protein [Halanaeroarchaeum sulfurireducens]ALG81897.1 putative membrane-associated protein [Halanaeroarchaeum sulfurireducens]
MLVAQLSETPSWLDAMLTSELGLLVLFGISILEGIMLLRFMPSELVVPSALLLIGSSIPEVVAIVALAVVGTTIGQTVLFYIARRGGREYLLQKGWVPLNESRLDRVDGWFDRWGVLAVPVTNTMLFVRGLLTVPAGLSDMDGRVFVVLSAIGSLSFQTILALLYLLAGEVIAL